ncbi:hypothetical protein FACS189499_06990 [Clostridia bacterium]|nr:hypothetical protein FACS189499_06990 [Clostridia bacterium]
MNDIIKPESVTVDGGGRLTFSDFVVPSARDSAGEIARKVGLIVAVLLLIAGVIMIITSGGGGVSAEQEEISRQREAALLREETVTELSLEIAEPILAAQKKTPEILPKFRELYAENSDLAGWIRIDGTPIDYPVMQAADNDFYLFKNFQKTYSIYGSVFADYHDKFTPESRPNNTVLYGHNINVGTYFAKVTNYNPLKHGSMSFYTEHPTVTFDTVYEEGTYKIFAGIYINTEEREGDVYPYYQKRRFKNRTEFYSFAANILDRSMFYTDVDLEYGDEILTLSTCYYPLGDNVQTRFAVFARRVRPGEDPSVDTGAAYQNKSPLYFKYYYAVNGGFWAGRTWDTAKLKGFDDYLKSNPEPNKFVT